MLEFVLRDFQTHWRHTTGSGVDRLSRSLNSVDHRVKNRPVIILRPGESRILRQQVQGIKKCGNRNRNVFSRSGREESVNAQTFDGFDKTPVSEVDLQTEICQNVSTQYRLRVIRKDEKPWQRMTQAKIAVHATLTKSLY